MAASATAHFHESFFCFPWFSRQGPVAGAESDIGCPPGEGPPFKGTPIVFFFSASLFRSRCVQPMGNTHTQFCIIKGAVSCCCQTLSGAVKRCQTRCQTLSGAIRYGKSSGRTNNCSSSGRTKCCCMSRSRPIHRRTHNSRHRICRSSVLRKGTNFRSHKPCC